jgi:2-polyprenyl-6-methoxyphenol hydroxylase-like FAD-dependent oxidoreductase
MGDIRKVLIVGAGIGGLGAGAALAQRGVDVEIVEIKPEPNVYGVGINQPANSLRALDALGVLDEVRSVGFEFDETRFHDHCGNLVVRVASGLGDERVPPNTGLSRRDLHAILIGAAERSGARITYGTTATDIADDNGAAEVTLSDGREEEYDLVIGFDGINSPLRKRLFGDAYDPVYTGYGVWRVTVPRPDGVNYCALFQSPGAKAGHIPLSRDWMYLLLVHPEPHHARFDRATYVDMLRERLAPFEGIVAEIRENLEDSDDVVYSPLSEIMLPAPWFKARILLCGDRRTRARRTSRRARRWRSRTRSCSPRSSRPRTARWPSACRPSASAATRGRSSSRTSPAGSSTPRCRSRPTTSRSRSRT